MILQVDMFKCANGWKVVMEVFFSNLVCTPMWKEHNERASPMSTHSHTWVPPPRIGRDVIYSGLWLNDMAASCVNVLVITLHNSFFML